MEARVAKIVTGLSIVGLGVYGVLLYLDATTNPPSREIATLKAVAGIVLFVLLAVNAFFQWRKPATINPAKDISSALSGVVVVLTTGLAIAAALGWRAHHWVDFIPSAVAVLLTLATARAVYRFASKFSGQIGEARFSTVPTDGANDR